MATLFETKKETLQNDIRTYINKATAELETLPPAISNESHEKLTARIDELFDLLDVINNSQTLEEIRQDVLLFETKKNRFEREMNEMKTPSAASTPSTTTPQKDDDEFFDSEDVSAPDSARTPTNDQPEKEKAKKVDTSILPESTTENDSEANTTPDEGMRSRSSSSSSSSADASSTPLNTSTTKTPEANDTTTEKDETLAYLQERLYNNLTTLFKEYSPTRHQTWITLLRGIHDALPEYQLNTKIPNPAAALALEKKPEDLFLALAKKVKSSSASQETQDALITAMEECQFTIATHQSRESNEIDEAEGDGDATATLTPNDPPAPASTTDNSSAATTATPMNTTPLTQNDNNKTANTADKLGLFNSASIKPLSPEAEELFSEYIQDIIYRAFSLIGIRDYNETGTQWDNEHNELLRAKKRANVTNNDVFFKRKVDLVQRIINILRSYDAARKKAGLSNDELTRLDALNTIANHLQSAIKRCEKVTVKEIPHFGRRADIYTIPEKTNINDFIEEKLKEIAQHHANQPNTGSTNQHAQISSTINESHGGTTLTDLATQLQINSHYVHHVGHAHSIVYVKDKSQLTQELRMESNGTLTSLPRSYETNKGFIQTFFGSLFKTGISIPNDAIMNMALKMAMEYKEAQETWILGQYGDINETLLPALHLNPGNLSPDRVEAIYIAIRHLGLNCPESETIENIDEKVKLFRDRLHMQKAYKDIPSDARFGSDGLAALEEKISEVENAATAPAGQNAAKQTSPRQGING